MQTASYTYSLAGLFGFLPELAVVLVLVCSSRSICFFFGDSIVAPWFLNLWFCGYAILIYCDYFATTA